MDRLIVTSLLCAASLLASQQARPVLEGLDPVRLTEGEEAPGNPKLTASHGPFLYQFASDETRARFQKEPEKYGIQLGGACARMGAPTVGNPDAYFVYDHRIYVFGSQGCYKLFAANPAKYLDKDAPQWNPDSQSRERGKALLDKAAAGIGDLSAIRGFMETRSRGGSTIIRSIDLKSASYRSDTKRNQVEFGELSLSRGAYNVFHGEMHRSPEQFDASLRRSYERDLLVLLNARGSGEFDAYSGQTDSVMVRWKGAVTRLEIDPATGSVMTMEYSGRGSGGAVGKVRVEFTEHRKSGNWTVPHRARVSLDGAPESTLSWETTEFIWNPADLEAKFRVTEPKGVN